MEEKSEKFGTFYLKIKVRLEMDQPEEAIREAVNELHYEISSDTIPICDTEIVDVIMP